MHVNKQYNCLQLEMYYRIIVHVWHSYSITAQYATVTRIKDGTTIRIDEISDNSGVVYEITDLTEADRGTYTCRAASKGGKQISRSAYLDVNGKYLQNWDTVDLCDYVMRRC